ncbi:MAG: hypothetical protein KJ926_05980, partial [Candidatus Omnitrophica bacterium]|nr:hypothetical protein [Candidatus Omnitrophota bacterium]
MIFKTFRLLFLVSLALLFAYQSDNFAEPDYRELTTSFGRVITGISKEEALDRYGYPASLKDDIWYYPKPYDLFIYLSPISSLHLYPEYCDAFVDAPFELKALAELPGYQLSDVTQDVEFIISEPKKFKFKKTGIFIPEEEGQYQIMAKYRNIYSSPSFVEVKQSYIKPGNNDPLRIDTLPYKPILPVNGSLSPLAYGTFIDDQGKSIIKDLSINVKWYCEGGKCSVDNYSNVLSFYEPGKFKIFCKYGDFISSIQEIEVGRIYNPPRNRALKNIMLLPELISTTRDERIALRAFGTFDDNSVEEVTKKVNWNIKDNEIIQSRDNGFFLAKSEGITDVSSGLDFIESLPVKISVYKKTKAKSDSLPQIKEDSVRNQDEKNKLSPEDKILDNIKAFKDSVSNKNKSSLSYIKTSPDRLEVSLGEVGSFRALAVYNDNSSQDVTLAGEWSSLPGSVARVSRGQVSTVSQGEAMVTVEYKGVKALPVRLFIKEPKLLSIVVSMDNSRLAMNAKAKIKAEGYYTDNLRRDITALVKWRISKAGIIKIMEGYIFSRSFGETQISAEHLGIKSLPVNISVIFTLGWLFWIICNIVIILILITLAYFFVLYLINLKKINRLNILKKDNARGFIISIYRNSQDILGLFGVRYNKFMSPRFYASLSQQNKVVRDNAY